MTDRTAPASARPETPARPWQLGPATPVGVCLGPGLGLLLGDVPLGFAAGLALGAGTDAVLGLRRTSGRRQRSRSRRSTTRSVA